MEQHYLALHVNKVSGMWHCCCGFTRNGYVGRILEHMDEHCETIWFCENCLLDTSCEEEMIEHCKTCHAIPDIH